MPNGKKTCDGFVLLKTFRLWDSAAFLKCDFEAQFRLFFRIATGTSIEKSSCKQTVAQEEWQGTY